MGAKCSKAPDRGEQENSSQTATPPRFHKTSNGPSPAGQRKELVDVGNLEEPAETPQGGWGMKFAAGMKFADILAQDEDQDEATYKNAGGKSRDDKTKLTRVLSAKGTSGLRAKTSTVAKKGVLKVRHFHNPNLHSFFASFLYF